MITKEKFKFNPNGVIHPWCDLALVFYMKTLKAGTIEGTTVWLSLGFWHEIPTYSVKQTFLVEQKPSLIVIKQGLWKWKT